MIQLTLVHIHFDRPSSCASRISHRRQNSPATPSHQLSTSRHQITGRYETPTFTHIKNSAASTIPDGGSTGAHSVRGRQKKTASHIDGCNRLSQSFSVGLFAPPVDSRHPLAGTSMHKERTLPGFQQNVHPGRQATSLSTCAMHAELQSQILR